MLQLGGFLGPMLIHILVESALIKQVIENKDILLQL